MVALARRRDDFLRGACDLIVFDRENVRDALPVEPMGMS